MKPYEQIDISGDAGIRAFGETLEKLFENAAAGMYSLMTDPESVLDERKLSVSIGSHSRESLLVAWLNELIFLFDTQAFVGKRAHVKLFEENRLEGEVWGEEFDSKRHGSGLLVKAATYHRLGIEKKNDLWEAEVIFDI
jgi:SHS2 domain-containing protein